MTGEDLGVGSTVGANGTGKPVRVRDHIPLPDYLIGSELTWTMTEK